MSDFRRNPPALPPALVAAILDHLARFCRHSGNRESLTYLMTSLRDSGWKNLRHPYDFAEDCEKAGFTVVREAKGTRGTHHTFIGV
jgi:hypothetical protein